MPRSSYCMKSRSGQSSTRDDSTTVITKFRFSDAYFSSHTLVRLSGPSKSGIFERNSTAAAHRCEGRGLEAGIEIELVSPNINQSFLCYERSGKASYCSKQPALLLSMLCSLSPYDLIAYSRDFSLNSLSDEFPSFAREPLTLFLSATSANGNVRHERMSANRNVLVTALLKPRTAAVSL